MEENRFWSMIEAAWTTAGGHEEARQALVDGDSHMDAYSLGEALSSVVAALRKALSNLPREELLTFDRILERKLYDIDRADIHERTDGSDDGFLYCRGFIVALGQQYYNAVNDNPDLAVVDAEGGAICYLSRQLYQERFGNMPPSGISRESCSNSEAWPEDG